jgi:hypothetical protein
MRASPVVLATGLFLVRPAWAHSRGCESHRKLITTNEAVNEHFEAENRTVLTMAPTCDSTGFLPIGEAR